MSPRIATGVVIALALWAHTARAEEGAVSLTWTAPAGCPTQTEVLAQIRSAVGPAVSAHDPVYARALLARGEGETWRGALELSVGGQESTRQVEGETCRAVADAVVVMVALAVNPDAALPPATAEPPAPPAPSPPVTPVPPAAPAPVAPGPSVAPPEVPVSRSEPGPARRHPVSVGASFLVATGTLPAFAYGAEATVGWAPSRFGLEGSAEFLAPQRAILATRPEGATFWLAHLGAQACYDVLEGVLDLAPCAGGGAEWTFAHGLGSTFPASPTASAAIASFGARARAHLSSHLVLRLAVGAVVPFARPPFVIHTPDGNDQVFQASVVQGRATAGVEIHF